MKVVEVPRAADGSALPAHLAAQLRVVNESWIRSKSEAAATSWFLTRQPAFELETTGTFVSVPPDWYRSPKSLFNG